MTEIDDVIRHAVMAGHDGELSSIVILMVPKNKEPEMHMAINSDDLFALNAVIDMYKMEMIRLMAARAEERKQRD